MGKLTARKVETAKAGKYGDGEGLQLAVSASGAKKWVLRYQFNGKPREMGLGGYPVVSLEEARQKARAARKLAKNGVDPIAEAKRDRSIPTFGEMADRVIADVRTEARNAKHVAQWEMTLSVYAKPLRALPVDQITTAHVLDALRPIWTAKPETADRTRGRIERVLNAAKAQGYRDGENPAQWRGHLVNLLPKRARLPKRHHAAMDYRDVPAFLTRLRAQAGMGARALEFTILTAARSGEALGARWSEIDLAAKVWKIPAERMKAGRPHNVPLSSAAAALLAELEAGRTCDVVFPGQKLGRPLSGMAMEMVLRRMEVEETVHGFRSSFRDWAGNETPYPRDLAETALAHVIGDKAEQAYRRSDALERRRVMMEDWARHCGGDEYNEGAQTSNSG